MSNYSRLQQIRYFTFIPLGGCGFTDQILQFSSFYKLGLSLGYKYIHTPFINRRSSWNIYNFLGFNNCFDKNILFFKARNFFRLKKYRYINLEINDNLLRENNVKTFCELQDFIRKSTLKLSKDDFLNEEITIVFKLIPGGRKFFSLIHSHIPDFPDRLDLQKIYFRNRKRNPVKSRFIDGNIKLLVHIRLGDIGTIKTPWKTFIPLTGPKKLVELSSLDDVELKHILDIKDYYCFIKKFISCFDSGLFSIIISSDGYKRTFRKIQNNIKKFDFNSNQLKQLKKLEATYDRDSFSIFKDLRNHVCLIGENDKNLHDLIHSSLTADIIVIGTQQRMLPKLIANYYDLNNPKIFIVLHKTENLPNYEKDLSLHSGKAKVIPVRIDEDDFNLEDVVAKVHLEISSKIAALI